MEKLIKEFYKECDITSKLANRLWKIGNIIFWVILLYFYISKQLILGFILGALTLIALFILCEIINIKHIKKKLKLKKIILKRNKEQLNIYQELDKFQKKWICDYCKRNKLNTMNKLKILKEELKLRRESNTIKYLNPVIIGTLLIAVWEEIVNELVIYVGLKYAIIPLILLAIIISLVLGQICKEWKDEKQFINLFQEYSSYERLERLLLYKILKTNK